MIPPWQNSDEPQHLMTARLVLRHGGAFELGVAADPEGEAAILASMAHHRWWAHYGLPTPEPLPATFEDGPGRVVKDYFGPPGGGSRLYYRALAGVFRMGGVEDVVSQMYVMRLVAAVVSMLTVVCVWLATRAWLDVRGSIVVTAIVVLHPQFVIASTTASPDAVVNLAGALVWLSAVRACRGAPLYGAPWLAAMWGAAAAAFLVRRMGAPLLVVTAATTVWLLGRAVLRDRGRGAPLMAAAAVVAVLVVVAGAAAWLLPDEIAMARQWGQFDVARSARTIADRLDALPGFLAAFFQSFWLSAGWLRYQAPGWWMLTVTLVTATACAGFVLRPRRSLSSLACVAAALMALQVAAVVAYHFGILRSGPQGRYVFPVIAAIASLLWVGWRSWFPDARQPVAAAAMLAIAAVLNATAWMGVVLPAYLGDVTSFGAGR